MNARFEAGAPAAIRGLARRALSLGAANAFEYAVQFLLPVVLVRCLEPEAFGEYRLLWLATGTAMAVVTQAMPGCLYYYLPRADAATRRLYINQTLLFLAAAGLVAAWAVSSWNPWLPDRLDGLAARGAIVPAFVLLWVIASFLDLLPTVEERVAWQARATISLSMLRAVALSLTAILTQELASVLLALLAFVAVKIAVLLAYVAGHHGLRGPVLRWREFSGQLKYAAPFGAAALLYGLRTQADLWVAAALFPVGLFAAFSIAAALGPLVNLFRVSVVHAFLPRMSRLQAAGDLPGMIELNRRANVLVGALVYPLLAFVFAFADEIVTIVYTAAYVDAAPVMRVYIAGLAALVVEVASITFLLRQGAFALRVGLGALIISVALSWLAAHAYGLAGAAAGSVTAVYLDLAVTLRYLARRTGVPVRRMQDWRALGRTVLAASLSAALAWGMVESHFAASAPHLRLLVGGALLATVYLAMQARSGMGLGWLNAARHPGREV